MRERIMTHRFIYYGDFVLSRHRQVNETFFKIVSRNDAMTRRAWRVETFRSLSQRLQLGWMTGQTRTSRIRRRCCSSRNNLIYQAQNMNSNRILDPMIDILPFFINQSRRSIYITTSIHPSTCELFKKLNFVTSRLSRSECCFSLFAIAAFLFE